MTEESIRNIVRAEVDRLLEPTKAFSDETDLFEVGLHSLLAVLLLSRIGEACGTRVGVRDLFVTPSVNGLVSAVMAARRG
jgi:hypothetical protein